MNCKYKYPLRNSFRLERPTIKDAYMNSLATDLDARQTANIVAQLSELLLSPTLVMATTPKNLKLTAISAKDGASTIECWQLSAPFGSSSQAGTVGAVFTRLGDTGNTSYTILPPKFDGGLHTAPAVQYVAFTAGKAVLSLPNSPETATIQGGRNGLIFAADTADVSKQGHITKYPGKKETIALQIPTVNGEIPAHTVLHTGPC
ncbi:MAG: hypothetical protein Q9217_005143 [Psora testacea]